MKIVIIGAGFTGLSAAHTLVQNGHEVVILEKESTLGGLATGYRHEGWKWHLDKAYHHLFTNDTAAIDLASIVGQQLELIEPSTCVYVNGHILPFDSPIALLRFPYLGVISKLRTAVGLAYLKIVNDHNPLEKLSATKWIRQFMGESSYRAIWEPLFRGKFHDQSDKVMLSWFWARIKKRTQNLYYPRGGFTSFLTLTAREITKRGGSIKLQTPVISIVKRQLHYVVRTKSDTYTADKILYTGPTVGFPFLFGRQVKPKRRQHTYLNAQLLILRLKKPFLKKIYWLNITDTTFPFLVLVDHTNFVSSKNYNGEHIVYIGNYLPPGHPNLTKTKTQLFKNFEQYLDRIKPGFKKDLIGLDLFTLPYAQAVVDTNFISNTKKHGTGLNGVFMANIDSVYPWDRGTNYAIEKGQTIAREMMNID